MPAGAFYLGLLCVLAGLGGVLALGLISDWGLTFPRWVPWLRGRRVPPWLPLTPTVLGSALMIGYSATLPWQFAADLSHSSQEAIFTPTGVLIGLPLLLAWTVALPLAGWSYYRRTQPAAARPAALVGVVRRPASAALRVARVRPPARRARCRGRSGRRRPAGRPGAPSPR